VAAYHASSGSHTVMHTDKFRARWTIGGVNICLRHPVWGKWVAHGALMTLGWGVAIPSGVLVARTIRDKDPLWFHLHRSLNYFGLACALAGWIIALVEFRPISIVGLGDVLTDLHAVLGLIVLPMGILQPINAVLRPKKDDGRRWIWNLVHIGIGRLSLLLGLISVFSGFFLLRDRESCPESWPVIVFGAWVGFLALVWVLLEVRNLSRTESNPIPRNSVAAETVKKIIHDDTESVDASFGR